MFTVTLAAALLSLRLSAQTCFAPCDIRAEVIIPKHADNRAWAIQIDGEQFQGHATNIDGENNPVIQPPVWFKHLGPGEYELIVVLYRVHGEIARIVRTIVVQ